jgi:hypothetical protein
VIIFEYVAHKIKFRLEKLKKNVFLQPEIGFVAHPDSYREDRSTGTGK